MCYYYNFIGICLQWQCLFWPPFCLPWILMLEYILKCLFYILWINSSLRNLTIYTIWVSTTDYCFGKSKIIFWIRNQKKMKKSGTMRKKHKIMPLCVILVFHGNRWSKCSVKWRIFKRWLLLTCALTSLLTATKTFPASLPYLYLYFPTLKYQSQPFRRVCIHQTGLCSCNRYWLGCEPLHHHDTSYDVAHSKEALNKFGAMNLLQSDLCVGS